MMFNYPPSPASIGVTSKDGYVHIHVTTGETLLALTQDELLTGGGLPISHGDGIQHFYFPKHTQLWAMGGSGGDSTGAIIIP